MILSILFILMFGFLSIYFGFGPAGILVGGCISAAILGVKENDDSLVIIFFSILLYSITEMVFSYV